MERNISEFDIQDYMTKGVERVVSDVLRATIKNPKQSAYMIKFAAATKAASAKRRRSEKEGEHIPAFLIASITSQCNLHCAGCYSRCNHATTDSEPVSQLSASEWGEVFTEAGELGISLILLAGGEPLIRSDVIKEASKHSNILFPIFTNGTYMNDEYLNLFTHKRNLVPIISIEGGKDVTDSRRGEGIYDKLTVNMNKLIDRGLIYGASVTVTTDNIREITSEEFINSLKSRGCKAIIFVEYVPVTEDSQNLAPGNDDRDYLREEVSRLRATHDDMVFISFPGDEKSSNGCVAAGRGFFHINSHGGAEPCPFSPYSDVNIKNTSLREALSSPLFIALRDSDILIDDHNGGCVLYEKRALVEQLIAN